MTHLRLFIGSMAATMLIAAASFCCVAAQNTPNSQNDAALPDGPGKAVIKKSCLSCHTASVITTKPGHTDNEWGDILNQMIGRGAILSDEDGDTLMDYLSTNFGPSWKGKPAASPATSGASSPGDKSARGNEAASASRASSSTEPATINVNKASAQELQAALGVTANQAELIIRHREQYGNYKTWKEVSSVPGVTAEKIKEHQSRLTF